MTLQDISNSGMLDGFVRKASLHILEHHLDNMRPDSNSYQMLKRKVQHIRGVRVRVERDSVRIRAQ